MDDSRRAGHLVRWRHLSQGQDREVWGLSERSALCPNLLFFPGCGDEGRPGSLDRSLAESQPPMAIAYTAHTYQHRRGSVHDTCTGTVGLLF